MFRSISLLARLSLIFFAFTLVNILLFWLATGSNQMRLIAEKASLEMHRTILGLEQKLFLMSHANAMRQRADFYRSAEARNLMLAVYKNSKNVTPPELLEFDVVSNSNSVFLSWPDSARKAELGSDEVQSIIKTLRLREFNNETFFSSPDVLNYRLTVYVPFLNDRGQDLVLRTVFSMDGMRTELSRLLRLGASIVVLLLLIQAGLGFFLYRLIVRPLRELRIASQITGRGEFHQITGYAGRRDEIGTLISTFNKMSADIRDQKETIRNNFEEIRSRDETMQHELMIAQHIQKSIFPKGEFPHALAFEYQPLYAVSGDFYDVYNLTDKSTGYLVCDASGHGVPAALLTMMAKSAFANSVARHKKPAELMKAVNAQMADSLEMTGQYLTAIFLKIYKNRIEYCNATHPEPIILLKGEKKAHRLKSNGFYVGMLTEPPFEFETGKVDIKKGAKIILYTDGITEARNGKGELFGVDRLTQAAEAGAEKNPEELRNFILAELALFTAGTASDDDVTLMVLAV